MGAVRDCLLVCNAGSSSLKCELFELGGLASLARGAIIGIGSPASTLVLGADRRPLDALDTHADALEVLFGALLDSASETDDRETRICAVGHRIVHGGTQFRAPVRVTPDIAAEIESLCDRAPLHNPAAVAVLEALESRLPVAIHVAVFDTAFFAQLPEHVKRYALPAEWLEHGVQRFGFHGIAHQYMYRRLAAAHDPGRPPRRVVSFQLGNGCSGAALADGVPVETSMGFTPLEGLVMATRPGDVDAGAVLHMLREGHSPDAIDRDLTARAGLLGLSGASGDMRELLALEADGHRGAALAIDAFCHRIRKYLGAYSAVLGGLDAVVFGGGIGENASVIRARICRDLEWLGISLDPEANDDHGRGLGGRVSRGNASVDVRVVEVREELPIAEAVASLMFAGVSETSLVVHRAELGSG